MCILLVDSAIIRQLIQMIPAIFMG